VKKDMIQSKEGEKQCEVCGRVFKHERYLRLHALTHKNSDEIQVKQIVEKKTRDHEIGQVPVVKVSENITVPDRTTSFDKVSVFDTTISRETKTSSPPSIAKPKINNEMKKETITKIEKKKKAVKPQPPKQPVPPSRSTKCIREKINATRRRQPKRAGIVHLSLQGETKKLLKVIESTPKGVRYLAIAQAFYFSCAGGHEDTLKNLLSRYGSSSSSVLLDKSTRKDGKTCLHVAAGRGHVSVLLKILDFVKSSSTSKSTTEIVNARDKFGATALHWACSVGSIDCVKLLLESNSNVTIRDKKGRSALEIACSRSHFDVAQILISRIQGGHATLICWASSSGHTEIVSKCLKRDEADTIELLKHSDSSGRTAVILAAANGMLKYKAREHFSFSLSLSLSFTHTYTHTQFTQVTRIFS